VLGSILGPEYAAKYMMDNIHSLMGFVVYRGQATLVNSVPNGEKPNGL
jgi:hypothetical protein